MITAGAEILIDTLRKIDLPSCCTRDDLPCRVPVLGLLGHQSIGPSVFGGRVLAPTKLFHGKSSRVQHDGKSIFAGVDQNFSAGRYHSLIVEDSSLPDCLEVSARTEDGIIMGLRHRTMKIEGVAVSS